VQSTTAGEQMVLRALGLPESGGHVVTDTLHFFGSIPLYEELARQGVQVSWVRPRDGRIELEDMRRAIRPGTKLVALSLVSTVNGFQHDLKAVCDLAHEAGAYVFADIIHAAGCVPLDLHASGVDFASTASYKWLMGDFGLGFLYVRKDVQPKLRRAFYGYYGIGRFESHVYPLDPPGDVGRRLRVPRQRGRRVRARHAFAHRDRAAELLARIPARERRRAHPGARAAAGGAPQGRVAEARLSVDDAARVAHTAGGLRLRRCREDARPEAAGREGEDHDLVEPLPDLGLGVQRHGGHRPAAGGARARLSEPPPPRGRARRPETPRRPVDKGPSVACTSTLVRCAK
jgi:hypothetical protein